MADLSPRNLANIRSGNFTPQQLAECLQDIVASHNHVAAQVNASPVGLTPPPAPHAAISVKGGAGIADVQITDNADSYRGKEHAFDYTFDGWKTSHTKVIGEAQNWRGTLGTGNLEVRSYARYGTSAPSAPVYHAPISTGGSVEPPMQAGQNVGLPTQPFMGVKTPKRG